MLYKIDPKTNEIVAKYASIKEAANLLLVPRQTIKRATTGEKATAYGFKWSLVDPKCKTDTRRRVEDLKAAKALSEAYGGSVEDYL